MNDRPVNKTRRRLVISTSVVGGVGALTVCVPFIASMTPSERAKAGGAPVEVDISKLEPGQKIDVEWRGKVVWVISRTAEMLEQVKKADALLVDPKSDNNAQQPEYAKNEFRSRKPEILVVEGVCTHLGCSPTYRKEIAPADLGPEWPGGFFCPCHNSKFDLAGRVFKGVPAPYNLRVPPYEFLAGGTKIMIGEDSHGA
jgi:ubiquinol-cytochrome c reductase iron-sulfur subunit